MQESDKYLKRYAQTEYNQAFAGAQMAAKWKGFEADADLYPNLEYRAVRDKRTRPEHARLHGTVLPVNDPFWDKYYPPNGYGCRCDVTATDKEMTDIPTPPEVPKEMQINTGKTARIFDNSHPYYKNTDKDTQARIEAFVSRNIRPADDVLKAYQTWNTTYATKEWEQAYFDGNTGGFTAYHNKHKFAVETGKYEKETARILARNGYAVPLLDESGFTKSADTIINGVKTEIKVMSGSRNMVTRAKRAIEQGAKRIIFYIKFDDDKELYKRLNNVSQQVKLKEIWFIKDGELHYYKK